MLDFEFSPCLCVFSVKKLHVASIASMLVDKVCSFNGSKE